VPKLQSVAVNRLVPPVAKLLIPAAKKQRVKIAGLATDTPADRSISALNCCAS
jgi:hypothetical protein